MGTDPISAPQSDAHRYEAVLRISEAIAACSPRASHGMITETM
jgi:hypothetical protein